MYYLSDQQQRIYQHFKSLEHNDFAGLVRFYEEHQTAMRTLGFEENLDCTLHYARALFETGDHRRHLPLCDHLLELTIVENVYTWEGEDLYTTLLFYKAASLHHLREDAAAEHVLRELLKIQPHHQKARHLLQVNLLRRRPRWLLGLRAAGLLLLLGAVAAIIADLFVVVPFFPTLAPVSRQVCNGLMATSVATLALAECIHYWRSRRSVEAWVQRAARCKTHQHPPMG